MSWRQGFTDEQILKMRRVLARNWKVKLDQVMDVEAVHFLTMNKPTPPDLADTQPMETLAEVRRSIRGFVWGLLFSTILWVAFIVLIVLVFA